MTTLAPWIRAKAVPVSRMRGERHVARCRRPEQVVRGGPRQVPADGRRPDLVRALRRCGFCFAPEMHRWSIEEFSTRIYNDDYHHVDPDYLELRPHANAQMLATNSGNMRSNPAPRLRWRQRRAERRIVRGRMGFHVLRSVRRWPVARRHGTLQSGHELRSVRARAGRGSPDLDIVVIGRGGGHGGIQHAADRRNHRSQPAPAMVVRIAPQRSHQPFLPQEPGVAGRESRDSSSGASTKTCMPIGGKFRRGPPISSSPPDFAGNRL